VARPSRKTGWSSTQRILIGAAELRAIPLGVDSNSVTGSIPERTALHHSFRGDFRSVPIQQCRAATAASEVAAIPDGDDPTTHAESVLAGSISHALLRRMPEAVVTRIDDGEAMPKVNKPGCAVAFQVGRDVREEALTPRHAIKGSAGTSSPIGEAEPYGHPGVARGVERTRGQSDNHRVRR
jgi:hypothetical protein